MAEVSQNRENRNLERTEVEPLQDTGVKIYHVSRGEHYPIRAKVRQGNGQVFVNGILLVELVESGQVRQIEELMQVLKRERLKTLDIHLEIGGLAEGAAPTELLSPPVLAYAIAEALTNLLGRL
ncbi:MAG: hypothetical protein ACUVTP_06050 [Candidatus Fervidibacter sp.]|uniref:hypothetical protein n=1 Tax=Candidatus Fervidibacter sp. TaxID=3100871 RepID=UPI004049FC46